MRTNKSKNRGNGKQTLRDILVKKNTENINIFNDALMLKVVPQIIAKSLLSKLSTNVDYISTQNKYYLNIAIRELGNSKREIEILKQIDQNSLESIVMGIYRLVCFTCYKVGDNNADVLKKIFMGILIDNKRLISECNKLVSDDDAVIQLDEFDEDGNVIKSNEQVYIELMTLLAIFKTTAKNLFKTAGYDVRDLAFFFANFNLSMLYSISGVLDTYLAKGDDTVKLLDDIIDNNPEKVKEILELYKNNGIFV